MAWSSDSSGPPVESTAWARALENGTTTATAPRATVTTDVNRIVSCPRVRSHAQYGGGRHEVSEMGSRRRTLRTVEHESSAPGHCRVVLRAVRRSLARQLVPRSRDVSAVELNLEHAA